MFRAGLHSAGRFAEDILFPRKCPVCDDALPFSMDPRPGLYSLICRECLPELSFAGPLCCEKCGRSLPSEQSLISDHTLSSESFFASEYSLPSEHPFPSDEHLHPSEGSRITKFPRLCSDCQSHIRLFEKCFVLLDYAPLERDMLSDIKYRGKKGGLVLFALLISERLGKELKSLGAEALIPVPVHKERLRKRGYNQAALLAERLSDHLGIACREDILKRRINTRAQKELSYEDRILNLQDAFFTDITDPSASGNAQQLPETVILVDDIYTTGGTMEVCTEVLLRAGIKKVYGLCICAGREQ